MTTDEFIKSDLRKVIRRIARQAQYRERANLIKAIQDEIDLIPQSYIKSAYQRLIVRLKKTEYSELPELRLI